MNFAIEFGGVWRPFPQPFPGEGAQDGKAATAVPAPACCSGAGLQKFSLAQRAQGQCPTPQGRDRQQQRCRARYLQGAVRVTSC